MLYSHTKDNRLHFKRAITKAELMRVAEDQLVKDYRLHETQKILTEPEAGKRLFRLHLGHHEQEVFAVAFLDNRHRLIAIEDLFFGTIDGSQVHPREVVRRVIHHNAAAVMFGHNHPSGVAEPSAADRAITRRLVDALALIEVRTLDHFVVGDSVTSFAERGLL